MEVVMSIDLAHHLPHPEDPFITIGDATEPNVNINLGSTKAEVSFTAATFPNLDTSPYALQWKLVITYMCITYILGITYEIRGPCTRPML